MLSHGAELIVTAEDAFNPSLDPDYPQSVFPLPGPGMFASMFRKLMYPRGEGNLRVCGKGGAEGDEFMIGHALQMLRQQGHHGDPSTVLTVGTHMHMTCTCTCTCVCMTCACTCT